MEFKTDKQVQSERMVRIAKWTGAFCLIAVLMHAGLVLVANHARNVERYVITADGKILKYPNGKPVTYTCAEAPAAAECSTLGGTDY